MSQTDQAKLFDPISTATLFELRGYFPQLASPKLWPTFMRALRALSLGDESCSVEERALIGQALGAFTLLACARWQQDSGTDVTPESPAVLAARVQALEATLGQVRRAIVEGDLEQLDLFAEGLVAQPPDASTKG